MSIYKYMMMEGEKLRINIFWDTIGRRFTIKQIDIHLFSTTLPSVLPNNLSNMFHQVKISLSNRHLPMETWPHN